MGIGSAPQRFGGLYYCEQRRMMFNTEGTVMRIRNKTLAVFLMLAGSSECVISRNEIIDRVWGGIVVSDDSLTQCISELRRLMGDRAEESLRTFHRRGYALIPDPPRVQAISGERPALKSVPGGIG